VCASGALTPLAAAALRCHGPHTRVTRYTQFVKESLDAAQSSQWRALEMSDVSVERITGSGVISTGTGTYKDSNGDNKQIYDWFMLESYKMGDPTVPPHPLPCTRTCTCTNRRRPPFARPHLHLHQSPSPYLRAPTPQRTPAPRAPACCTSARAHLHQD